MKKLSLALLLIWGILSAQSSAELYQRLSSRYSKLTSFQANLEQHNFYYGLNKEISYQGKIYFQAGKLLMSFSEPNVQRLYIDKGKAELYDGASHILYKSDILPEYSRMNPLEILQLYWDQAKVQILENSNGHSRVKLSLQKDPMLKEIEALIDDNTGLVKELSYIDNSDNVVSYYFTKILIDTKIPEDVWLYNYPEDTQIIAP
ncbi:MAG: hypothetical protein PWP64_229 [Candidatus Cloacimonadota bacterium]|nr:hypothetical protein [Candidatus Cloacimonadota bacterium]